MSDLWIGIVVGCGVAVWCWVIARLIFVLLCRRRAREASVLSRLLMGQLARGIASELARETRDPEPMGKPMGKRHFLDGLFDPEGGRIYRDVDELLDEIERGRL